MKKLNLGCGGRPLEGYLNVDFDPPEELIRRYPSDFISFSGVVQADIFSLEFADEAFDEVRADGVVEHIEFKKEKLFFEECIRLLKPGGTLNLSTVDFEATCKAWLAAEDKWIDFFRDDDQSIASDHWFGTHSYGYENRWGYLMATFFGSQNGKGQFHMNAYTEKKLIDIATHFGLVDAHVEHFRWKADRDFMLRLTATKDF